MTAMTDEDFEKLQALMASRAGYRLSRERLSLAEHRLGPVARREGFETVAAMLQSLWSRPVASLGWSVIESLLNPETWFNRDRAPFHTLAHDLLPALSKARNGQRVRVLSLGCSTGQEAYSIAIAALEAGADFELTAIDLNPRAIEKARSGLYTSFEIQRGLSAAAMLRWFDQVEDHWRARAELRQRMTFTSANLLDLSGDEGRSDIIFCRHVLDEMVPAGRQQALETLERRLVDDGCLFLGQNERLEDASVAFRPVSGRPGLYVKSPAFLRRAA